MKALADVCPSASVAVTVKESTAAALCAVCVPVIVAEPTPVVNVKPAVTAPVVTAKDVASVDVKVIVPTAAFHEKVPKDPEAVTHSGASLTVRSALAVRTANPELFSTLT